MLATQPKRGLVFWLLTPIRWLFAILGFVLKVAIIGWATLAIYYSNLPWPWLRALLAAAFMAFGVWALSRSRTLRRFLAFAGVFAGVVVWWISIRPSHDRPWRPEVAVMPRVSINGDRVRITGVRNFEYRSTYEFTPRYEEREVSLSALTSIDFFISYWMQGPVGHTFLSFNFSNAPPLCISIETRPEVGEGFSPIASLFKQFELIYVVGDERDIVRVRTNYRRDDVYLYHIRTSAENARRLFLIYLDRINELYNHPEFYHLLSNSCTINIVRYARAAGKVSVFDFRHFLNGFIDSYLYSRGIVDTTLPFEELRRRSRINDAALAAGNAPDFSERIRAAVPSPGE
jgi:hypothetical protein